MKTNIFFSKYALLSGLLILSAKAYSQEWETIATDAKNDVMRTDWADCTKMEYLYEEGTDEMSFRFTLSNMSADIAADFGINVMVNIEGSKAGTFRFWGNHNKTDKFNYILTAWVTGTPPSNYSGTIGVSNATGARSTIMNNMYSNNLKLVVDQAAGTITVSVARSEFVPDADLGVGETKLKFAGATGNSQGWNDDVYNSSKQVTLPLGTQVGTSPIQINRAIGLYPNPAQDHIQITGLSDKAEPFTIINHLGQVVLSGRLTNGRIDISGLDKGVFFLRMEGDVATPLRFTK